MNVPAILRFAPVFTTAILDDPKLARSRMVQRGALETINGEQAVPVLVNHDDQREVGRVRQIFTAGETDRRDWYFASVTLTDPPEWFRRNGAVSWSHNPLQEQDVNGTTRLLRGLLKEISILSPSVEPAEPLARVVWVGEARAAAAREEVIRHDVGQRLIRPAIGQVLGVR